MDGWMFGLGWVGSVGQFGLVWFGLVWLVDWLVGWLVGWLEMMNWEVCGRK
jgi:hypothetical protein